MSSMNVDGEPLGAACRRGVRCAFNALPCSRTSQCRKRAQMPTAEAIERLTTKFKCPRTTHQATIGHERTSHDSDLDENWCVPRDLSSRELQIRSKVTHFIGVSCTISRAGDLPQSFN